MKRTLLSLIVFTALAARSEVAVERVTRTSHYTGQGVERTLNWRDIIIRDLDGTNGAAIETIVIKGHKLYSVSRDSSRVFRSTVRGLNGRNYTVVTQGITETNETQVLKVDGLLARGLNTTLQVSEARQITYPRVFRGAAHRVELDSGEYRVIESTYTRLYSQTETREANARGNDVEAVLTRMVQRLQASGYVEVP
jgi:hypothetical protein